VPVDEFAGRPGVEHTTGLEHHQSIAQRFGLVGEVRHQQNRRACIAQCSDGVPHVVAPGRVKTLGHLVQHDEARTVQQSEHEKETLLLAAAQ